MLPEKIYIGAAEYKLIVGHIEADDAEYGNCDTHTQVITISNNQTAQSAGDTVLHEILHAIWNESGLAFIKRPDEETIVRITSSWLRMVFLQNPAIYSFVVSPSTWPHTATGDGNRKSK